MERITRFSREKGNIMSTYSNIVRNALSAVAAIAITASLLTASFTTAPQRTAAITVLA
jgi:hypothetical protein